MKRVIGVLLFICLMLPIVFGEEEDKDVTVLYADGSIEVMKQSELDVLTSGVSLARMDASHQIITTAVNQPMYMTETHYNEYYDDWRLKYIRMNDIISDIETELSGSTIKVAVLDSGVYPNHPDLNLTAGYDFGNNDSEPIDFSGHGSHVAGIIGAKSSGGDVTGVAPNILIVPVKVFEDGGSGGTDKLARGLRYAIDQGVDVINMSLSYESYDSVVDALLIEAEGDGIVVVAATGNDSNLWTMGTTYDHSGGNVINGVSVTFPAAHSTVLSVGSLSKDKLKEEVGISDFSNIAGSRTFNGVTKNAYIDVVAPGNEIVSWGQHGSDMTVIKSGTSMATPHVAGLAAILQDKYPSLSATQIRTIIRDTAYNPSIKLPELTDVGVASSDLIIGQGLIDVNQAMNYSPIQSMSLEDIEFEFNPNVLSYIFTVPYETQSTTLSYESISDSVIKLDTSLSTTSEVLTLSSASQTFVLEGTFGNTTKSYSIQIDKALPELKTYTINNKPLDVTVKDQTFMSESTNAHLQVTAGEGITVTIDDEDKPNELYDVTTYRDAVIKLTTNETPPRVQEYKIHMATGHDSLRLHQITFNGTDRFITDEIISDNSGPYHLGDFNYGTVFTASGAPLSGGDLTFSVNGSAFTQYAEFDRDGDINSNVPLPGQISTLDIKVTKNGAYNIYYFTFSRAHAAMASITYTTMGTGSTQTSSHNFDTTKLMTLSTEETSVKITDNDLYPVVVTYKVNTDDYDGNNVKSLKIGSNKVVVKTAFGVLGNPDYEELFFHAILTRAGSAEVKTLTYQAKNGSTNLDLYKDETFSTLDTSYDISVSNKMTEMTFDIESVYSDVTYSAKLDGSTIDVVSNKISLGELADGVHTLEIVNAYHAKGETGYDEAIYTYNIHVVNGIELSDIYLKSDGTDVLNFNENTLNYSVGILNGTTNVFKAVKADSTYGSMKWFVDGTPSDYFGTEETLELGKTYQLQIISPVASESKIFDISITERILDTNSKLNALSISGQSISPIFLTDTLAYTANVSNGVTSVVVKGTKTSAYATMTIDGNAVSSYTKALNTGANTVTVVVTAEDTTKSIYIITVNRSAVVDTPIVTPPVVTTSSTSVSSPTNTPASVVATDDVKTVKNEDGTEKVVVNVSEGRITDDLKDEAIKVVQVSLKGEKAADISLDASTIKIIGESSKPLEIAFENVVFKIPSNLLNQLNIREQLKVTFEQVSDDGTDKKIVSEVFELDIYDGTEKLKFDMPIPIVLTFDDSKAVNKNNLAVYFFNETTQSWIYAGGKFIGGNEISFEAKHFSKYAVRENNKTFEDIKTHWAKDAIEMIASREITNGVSKTEFAPDKTLTNAEFIVLLVKVLGLPEYSGSIQYENVKENEWYTSSIRKAIGADLIINTYAIDFEPNTPIKREEMASLLMASYFYYTNKDPGKMLITAVEFANDEDEVSVYFRKVVRMTYQLELIVGDNENNFNPKNSATRAEAAVVIQKLLKLLGLI